MLNVESKYVFFRSETNPQGISSASSIGVCDLSVNTSPYQGWWWWQNRVTVGGRL
jgi:hypothetical protein